MHLNATDRVAEHKGERITDTLLFVLVFQPPFHPLLHTTPPHTHTHRLMDGRQGTKKHMIISWT